jgi:hypothetical protein
LTRGRAGIILTFNGKLLIIEKAAWNSKFKHGASKIEHMDLRPNNLIMWEALKWYRHQGFETMRLGRTELENRGLLRLKRTWGPKEGLITYYRYDLRKKTFLERWAGSGALYASLLTRTPVSVFRVFGRLCYRYFG